MKKTIRNTAQSALATSTGHSDQQSLVSVPRELLKGVLFPELVSQKEWSIAHRSLRDLLAAHPQSIADSCVCGEPESPGIHRKDAPCYANLPQSIAAQSAPAGEREAVAFTAITDGLPDDEVEVVIYTEGTEFAREQFFHVRGSDLNPAYFNDEEFPMREECKAATHWVNADDLAALMTRAAWQRTQSPGVPEEADAQIGAVVWRYIDRMTDICTVDPAERILEQFVAEVRPIILAAVSKGPDHG